jgi:hypothetical protein
VGKSSRDTRFARFDKRNPERLEDKLIFCGEEKILNGSVQTEENWKETEASGQFQTHERKFQRKKTDRVDATSLQGVVQQGGFCRVRTSSVDACINALRDEQEITIREASCLKSGGRKRNVRDELLRQRHH